jgi:hypothetical protein
MMIELSIKGRQTSFSVIMIYRPPGSCTKFFEELDQLFSEINHRDDITVMGDFNIHVDNKNDPETVTFQRLLEQYGWVQLISSPTHEKGHTLDLVLTKVNSNILLPSNNIQ